MPVTLTAIFLLLRAPHWHLSRRFFAATIAVATFPPADVGQLPWVAVTAIPAGTALMLWCGLEGTEASRPLRRWQQLLPWALGSIYALCMAVYLLSTIPAGLWPYRGTWGGTAVMMIALLLALVRAYQRSAPLERRQLRWVLLGLFVAFLPYALFSLGLSLGMQVEYMFWEPFAGTFIPGDPARDRRSPWSATAGSTSTALISASAPR